MKKKIFIALSILALFVLVLASCNGGGEQACSHNFVDVEGTSTATCLEAGTVTQQCTLCQETQSVTAPAKGHDYPSLPTKVVKPTCMDKGYSEYKCNNCDDIKKANETNVDATNGHAYETVRVEPTCTDAGYESEYCPICETFNYDVYTILDAKKHTFEREGEEKDGFVVTDAKCEVNGYVTYTCTDPNCPETKKLGTTYTFEKTYDELTGEDATEEEKALGATLIALEHDFSVPVETVAPTCTKNGHTVYECSHGCGNTENRSDADMLGHSYERADATINYVVTLKPTCITEGKEAAYCEDPNCPLKDGENKYISQDEKYIKTIEATHIHCVEALKDPANYKYTGEDAKEGAANCTEAGYWTIYCTEDENCTYTEVYIDEVNQPALDHNYVLNELVLTNGKATCLTDGHYWYYCDRCGNRSTNRADNKTEDELKALGYNVDKTAEAEAKHVYTIGEFAVEPTCITNGIYQCKACPKTTEGYEGDTKTGKHDFKWEEAYIYEVVPATCSTEGYILYKCCNDPKCEETKMPIRMERPQDFTAMANHTFGELTVDGIYTCKVCHKSYRDVTVTTGAGNLGALCLCGKCEDEVTCAGPECSWSGSGKPSEPQKLVANETATFTGKELRVAKGVIELKSESGDTVYTVKLYKQSGEELVEVETRVSLETAGLEAYIYLSDVLSIAKIEITATTDATVSFYAPME